MTEAMPFLQKYDITFLRPPTIRERAFIYASIDLQIEKEKKEAQKAKRKGKKGR